MVRPLPQCRPGSAAGHLLGGIYKCRKRSNAGVPGAVAPGKINLESPPSPEGKSALRARVGGMGAEKQTKGRGDRQPRRQASAGRMVRPLPQCRPGSAAGHLYGRVCTCRKRSNAGVPGAVAPGKINLESPPSPEGMGAGGMGAEKKVKAGQTGDKKCTPPALARPAPGERTISNAEVPLPRSPLSLATGTANRKAVLSVLHRTGDAESPPVECRIGRLSQCRPGSSPGMQGAKPLA